MNTIGIRAPISFSFLLEHETAHVRHSNVKNEAAWLLGVETVTKFLRRPKRGRAQANRHHQFCDRIEHCVVVVDNEYYGIQHVA
jgi:hypothetical protein